MIVNKLIFWTVKEVANTLRMYFASTVDEFCFYKEKKLKYVVLYKQYETFLLLT